MFSSSPSTTVSGCHEGSSPVSAQVWWCWVSDVVHVNHGTLCGPVANKAPGQSHGTSFFRGAIDPKRPRGVCHPLSCEISAGCEATVSHWFLSKKRSVKHVTVLRAAVCWVDTVNGSGHLMLVPTE